MLRIFKIMLGIKPKRKVVTKISRTDTTSVEIIATQAAQDYIKQYLTCLPKKG